MDTVETIGLKKRATFPPQASCTYHDKYVVHYDFSEIGQFLSLSEYSFEEAPLLSKDYKQTAMWRWRSLGVCSRTFTMRDSRHKSGQASTSLSLYS